MTMTDDKRIFIDTSVMLHAAVPQSIRHGLCRAFMDSLEESDCHICVSDQVAREMLVQLMHPRTFTEPYTPAAAVLLTRPLFASLTILSSAPLAVLLDLVNQFEVRGKQVHDCNLVATMLSHGIHKIVTRNAVDFRRYEPVIEVVEVV